MQNTPLYLYACNIRDTFLPFSDYFVYNDVNAPKNLGEFSTLDEVCDQVLRPESKMSLDEFVTALRTPLVQALTFHTTDDCTVFRYAIKAILDDISRQLNNTTLQDGLGSARDALDHVYMLSPELAVAFKFGAESSLATVTAKLEHHKYKDLREFAHDLRQIGVNYATNKHAEVYSTYVNRRGLAINKERVTTYDYAIFIQSVADSLEMPASRATLGSCSLGGKLGPSSITYPQVFTPSLFAKRPTRVVSSPKDPRKQQFHLYSTTVGVSPMWSVLPRPSGPSSPFSDFITDHMKDFEVHVAKKGRGNQLIDYVELHKKYSKLLAYAPPSDDEDEEETPSPAAALLSLWDEFNMAKANSLVQEFITNDIKDAKSPKSPRLAGKGGVTTLRLRALNACCSDFVDFWAHHPTLERFIAAQEYHEIASRCSSWRDNQRMEQADYCLPETATLRQAEAAQTLRLKMPALDDPDFEKKSIVAQLFCDEEELLLDSIAEYLKTPGHSTEAITGMSAERLFLEKKTHYYLRELTVELTHKLTDGILELTAEEKHMAEEWEGFLTWKKGQDLLVGVQPQEISSAMEAKRGERAQEAAEYEEQFLLTVAKDDIEAMRVRRKAMQIEQQKYALQIRHKFVEQASKEEFLSWLNAVF
jgi:hypothetical protein